LRKLRIEQLLFYTEISNGKSSSSPFPCQKNFIF